MGNGARALRLNRRLLQAADPRWSADFPRHCHPSNNVVEFAGGQQSVGDALQRGCDVIVASAAIVLLPPLQYLIALAMKLSNRGLLLFRHLRIGLNGAVFNCLKFRTIFRTMVITAFRPLTCHAPVRPGRTLRVMPFGFPALGNILGNELLA